MKTSAKSTFLCCRSLTDHNGISPPNGGMSSGSHSNSSSSGEQDAPHLPCRNTFLESNSGMKGRLGGDKLMDYLLKRILSIFLGELGPTLFDHFFPLDVGDLAKVFHLLSTPTAHNFCIGVESKTKTSSRGKSWRSFSDGLKTAKTQPNTIPFLGDLEVGLVLRFSIIWCFLNPFQIFSHSRH